MSKRAAKKRRAAKKKAAQGVKRAKAGQDAAVPEETLVETSAPEPEVLPEPEPEPVVVAAAAPAEPEPEAPQARGYSWWRRVPALAALIVPLIATLVVLAEGRGGSVGAAAPGLREAVRPAWNATTELGVELDKLKPGVSRGPSIRAARKAAKAIEEAQEKLPKIDVPTSQGDTYAVAQVMLRTQANWVDAVGSTLANPRSERRAALARLAASAIRRAAAAQRFGLADEGDTPIKGTGHLLSATKRRA